MSSNFDPDAPQRKVASSRSPFETILGKDILFPKIASPKILRDQAGTLYVRYPDGSMRRAIPKGVLQRFGERPYRPRTIIRDFAAAMRGQKYLSRKEVQP